MVKGHPSYEMERFLIEDLEVDPDALESVEILKDPFGYAVLHIHSFLGSVRQLLFETETGAIYEIPKVMWDDVLSLPSALDMEVALRDHQIEGEFVEE